MLGVFLDIETSGLDPFRHIPLEIGCMVIDLYSGKELEVYETLVSVTQEEWTLRDPSSIAVNGLTWEMLQTGKPRSIVAKQIEEMLQRHALTNESGFFVCQNPSFDRPFFCSIIPAYRQEELRWPYHWLDLASMYWALQRAKEQREQPYALRVSKDTIAQALGLPPEARPHRSINGVKHLLLCYKHLVGFPGGNATR